MIADDDETPVRQEGQGFRSCDELIRFRRVQNGFVQVLHAFGKQLFPEGLQRVLLQVLLVSLEKENGGTDRAGEELVEFFAIPKGTSFREDREQR